MTTVRGTAETAPPSHHAKDPDRETRELTATGDTYADAVAALRSQVPDGWRLLLIDVAR